MRLCTAVLAGIGVFFASTAERNARADAQVCDEPRCASAPVEFVHVRSNHESYDYQTDWMPEGWDVQMRLSVRIVAQTEVEMEGDVVARWGDSMELSLPGRPQTGRLAFAYGLEVVPEVRIDVNLPGEGDFFWQGELPTPAVIPLDLMMDGETLFDPFAMTDTVSATGETQRVRVFSYGVLDGIIPIPGISGKIRLDAQLGLTTSYHTEEIAFADSPSLFKEDATSAIEPLSEEGYGAGLDVAVQPIGTLGYATTLTLYPHFAIKILGITVGDLDIAEWSTGLTEKTVDVEFDTQEARLSFADLELPADELAIEPGSTGRLAVSNRGEADLIITPVASPDAVTPDFALVAPGESAEIRIVTTEAFEGGQVLFQTNDPDVPVMTIGLENGALGAEESDGDTAAGEPELGGCSAVGRTAGSPSYVFLALVCGLVLRRRRRGSRAA